MVDWKALTEERLKEKNNFFLLISGDKSFKYNNYYTAILDDSVTSLTGEELFKLVVDKCISKAKEKYDAIRVVTGDNNGADSLTVDYAMSNDFDTFVYEADWDTVGAKAGFERNVSMYVKVGRAEHKGAILFWDGEDYMTRNLIYQAYTYAVPLRVYNYKLKRVLTSNEVLEIQQEEYGKQMKFTKY